MLALTGILIILLIIWQDDNEMYSWGAGDKGELG